jgi:hypothetical protein
MSYENDKDKLPELRVNKGSFRLHVAGIQVSGIVIFECRNMLPVTGYRFPVSRALVRGVLLGARNPVPVFAFP